MKRKCHSYLEIKLDNVFIGYSTIAYHYYDYTRNIISSEILPYPIINSIPNIQLAQQWSTYTEDFLNIGNSTQDEQLTTGLLKNVITNLNQFNLSYEKRRDAFHLDINVDGTIHKCFLVHEYHIIPQFKQVQILSDNSVFRFDINKPDFEIQNEIAELILEK